MLTAGFGGPASAAGTVVELTPVEVRATPGGGIAERYSERTLVVGIEVDRESARVLHYAVKPRPYITTTSDPKRAPAGRGPRVELEVVLRGPGATIHTRRVEVPFLCLDHGREVAGHEEGDTYRPHRTAVLVELPELPGFDRIDVAVLDSEQGRETLRRLGEDRLDIDRFQAAGGPLAYDDVKFADPQAVPKVAAPQGSSVLWPEDFDDPDLFRLSGNADEVDRRINLVLVPDGYTYAQKALMEAHADAVIAEFRSSSPHAEHDAFYNYILVYAYSIESGNDQCDCGVIRNSAMGSFFPLTNPACGHSDNRCIRYGGDALGCDDGGLGNIISAELRAPARDSTLIMVNTTRYGGCASDRGVFAAAHAIGPDIAVHEAGHSLAGLADEYGGNGCGSGAWEINTSQDPVDGAWPEWIVDLGTPRDGGQTFDTCIYRPTDSCRMLGATSENCAVCRQRWALRTFGHPRVKPTAPVASYSPPLLLQVEPGQPTDFSVTTRLPSGAEVQNSITWTVEGPGDTEPTVVASGVTTYQHAFPDEGQYVMRCQVIAGTNFIKPSRYLDNVETVAWQVDVSNAPPAEVAVPIHFASQALLLWEQVPGVNNNVYRGTVDALPGDHGSCFAHNVPWTDSFVFDGETPPAGTIWTYLITGLSGVGEGTLGTDSFGNPRVNNNPCP